MIQLEDDIAFQRKSWLVERIGWGVMLTILVAALAGLFASGPLSSKKVESADGSTIVRYERFARAQAPTAVRVQLKSILPAGTATVVVGGGLASNLEIADIRPQPVSVTALPDGLRFVFRVAPSEEPSEAVFTFRPQTIGDLEGEIGLAGQAPVRLVQFVYP